MPNDFWNTIKDVVEFKAFGKEDDLKTKIEKVLNGKNASYSINFDDYDNLITLNLSNLDAIDKKKIVSKIFNILDDRIYADKNVNLPSYCIELLKFTGKKLGVAESITGGLIANALVSISGASEVLCESLVCYANVSKMKVLNVDESTLAKHTAVSSRTAYEMVCGILNHEYNDYGIATTGYAENFEGESGGKVFIGIGSRERIDVHEYKFEGDRNTVRKRATNTALFHLVKKLKGAFDYTR